MLLARTIVPVAATMKRSICTFDESDFSGRTSWPYTAADLNRLDNSDDSKFYDDMAINSLSEYYRECFEGMANANTNEPMPIDVLDLCSSWISHLPEVNSDSNFRYGNHVPKGASTNTTTLTYINFVCSKLIFVGGESNNFLSVYFYHDVLA